MTHPDTIEAAPLPFGAAARGDTGIVFRIKKYAIHDGPGIRTTVFLKGCPLRCAWCHNPEGIGSVVSPPTAVGDVRLAGRRMTVAQVVAAVAKDTLFYDQSGGGVTLSGGEPMAQPEFTATLLRACRRQGIHTILDTSGYAAPEVLQAVLKWVDEILFDLKLMDDTRHRRYTGVSNRRILSNLDELAAEGPPVQIRFPLVPGVTDTEDNLKAVVGYLAARPRLTRIALLPYHHTAAAKYRRLGMENRLIGVRPPDPGQVAAVRAGFESAGLTVAIGG